MEASEKGENVEKAKVQKFEAGNFNLEGEDRSMRIVGGKFDSEKNWYPIETILGNLVSDKILNLKKKEGGKNLFA